MKKFTGPADQRDDGIERPDSAAMTKDAEKPRPRAGFGGTSKFSCGGVLPKTLDKPKLAICLLMIVKPQLPAVNCNGFR